MQKEKSSLSWIMQWAGTHKVLYIVSVILAVFNVIFKMIPYFIIGDIVSKLVNGENNLNTYLIEVALIAASFVVA